MDYADIIIIVLGFLILRFIFRYIRNFINIRSLFNDFELLGYKVGGMGNSLVAERYPLYFSLSSSIRSEKKEFYDLEVQLLEFNSPKFTLIKEGLMGKIIKKVKKENFDHNIKIKTDNMKDTREYLSQTDFLRNFRNVISYPDSSIVTTGNKLIISFSMKKDREKLLKYAKSMINYAFNYEKKKIKTIDRKISYKCYSCNTRLDFSVDKCGHCGTIAPSCIICYNDPKPSDQVSFLSCCQSIAHTDHIVSWLRKKNICPYCNEKQPLILEVSG